uniref:Uncharacterized protein n=1 Tax=Anguilla anguilla TaxID=7936 RepID=A0A0E9UPN9_ANGAN
MLNRENISRGLSTGYNVHVLVPVRARKVSKWQVPVFFENIFTFTIIQISYELDAQPCHVVVTTCNCTLGQAQDTLSSPD